MPKFFDPNGRSRLGNLELVARQVVEGFLIGRHRSPYHDFFDGEARIDELNRFLLDDFPTHDSPRDETVRGSEVHHLGRAINGKGIEVEIGQVAEEAELNVVESRETVSRAALEAILFDV